MSSSDEDEALDPLMQEARMADGKGTAATERDRLGSGATTQAPLNDWLLRAVVVALCVANVGGVGALLALVPKYRFLLPPYFLNNARALGTLEGMARTADPNFNILAIVYPFAVKRLLQNPTGSPVLRRVLRQLISNKRTGRMSLTRLKLMIEDAASLTGVSRMAIIASAMTTTAGWRLAVESVFAGAFWCVGRCVGAVFFVTGITAARNAWGRFIYRLNRDIDDDEDGTPARVGSVF